MAYLAEAHQVLASSEWHAHRHKPYPFRRNRLATNVPTACAESSMCNRQHVRQEPINRYKFHLSEQSRSVSILLSFTFPFIKIVHNNLLQPKRLQNRIARVTPHMDNIVYVTERYFMFIRECFL